MRQSFVDLGFLSISFLSKVPNSLNKKKTLISSNYWISC